MTRQLQYEDKVVEIHAVNAFILVWLSSSEFTLKGIVQFSVQEINIGRI